jgi:hypothetical protein
MLDKLNKIFEIIEENHLDFYFNHSKEEFEEFKKEALSKFKLEDDYDLLYICNYIIKRMVNENDGHTIVRYSDFLYLGVLPRIINNKMYIYKAVDDIKNYLYDEILEINGVNINTIIDEVRDRCLYQTEGFREANVERNMIDVSVLRSLPSIDNKTDEFIFKVDHNGEVKEIKIPFGYAGIKNYRHFEDKDRMHIVYSLCREFKPNQMINMVNEIKNIDGINYYIVDLRGNTGGNSGITEPLLEFLKGKKIIVLIDKYVYSAGRLACYDLRNLGAIFIGTDIGSPLNCFGNCPAIEFEKFYVQPSNAYYTYYDSVGDLETKEEFKEFLKRDDYKKIMEPRYFHPDIYVEESIDALREGRDVYLEKAYEYIDSLENKKKLG